MATNTWAIVPGKSVRSRVLWRVRLLRKLASPALHDMSRKEDGERRVLHALSKRDISHHAHLHDREPMASDAAGLVWPCDSGSLFPDHAGSWECGLGGFGGPKGPLARGHPTDCGPWPQNGPTAPPPLLMRIFAHRIPGTGGRFPRRILQIEAP